jgi:hypothetical protein
MVERWDNVEVGPLGERMINFLDRYPKADKIYVTSAMDGDHGTSSHHYGLWYKGSRTAAIDIGANSAKKMRDVARWLYDNFAALTVELIHTTPFSDDDGFYVKNQVRYPGGAIYGKATMKAHRNHVHWAMSADLMTVLERFTDPESATGLDQAAARSGEGLTLGLSPSEHRELLRLTRELAFQVQRLADPRQSFRRSRTRRDDLGGD